VPSYCVSGAGTTAYNGTYDLYTADVYRKVGATTIQIGYNGDGVWFFINGAVEGYVAYSSSATPPLTGWVVSGNGTGTVPTLTEGACGVAPSPTPNTIRIKRSSTTTAVPTTLLEGELAANIIDKKVWIGDSTKTPVLISDYNNAGGSGTVTSVGLTVPTGLSVANSPVTTADSLDITLTAGYAIPTTSSQTNWDSAYTQRLQWDGGATNLVAATGRTSLGATTIGTNLFTLPSPADIAFIRINLNNTVTTLSASSFRTSIGATTVGANLFTLTNPAAITFPRFNADNTVSALDAATFRTAIGAGTSSTSGTVTSIATTSPITGGTITGTGTIGINAASANTASYVVQRDASGDFSAGKITLGGSGSSTLAQLTFSGSTNNWIDLGTNGYAAPAFTTRSVGTKVVFYKDLGASSTDYAAGVQINALWFSIPAATSDRAFRFYGGTTNIASLTGDGSFSANKKITGETLSSTVAIGTEPITVTSTTQVANLNASLLEGYSTATANTVSTIVRRDASGNFSAGTITASLTGNATGLAASAALTTPTITGLNETRTALTISVGAVAVDCSIANVFTLFLNAAVTSLTFSNVPTAPKTYGFTLAVTADGTARSLTWPASVKWAGGTAPTLTSTNGKIDIFVLSTWDGGTNWYAMVGGQNF
jgi:hypothetical protein